MDGLSYETMYFRYDDYLALYCAILMIVDPSGGPFHVAHIVVREL